MLNGASREFEVIGVDVGRGAERALLTERAVDAFHRTECLYAVRHEEAHKGFSHSKGKALPPAVGKFQEYKIQFAWLLADAGDFVVGAASVFVCVCVCVCVSESVCVCVSVSIHRPNPTL
jgi:hypothetical protein